MKFTSLITLVSLLFVVNMNSVQAQDSSLVTFQVDMSAYPGTFTTVELGSNFSGWCGNCAFLEDADSDDIWTLEVSVPNSTIEYKFHVDGWDIQESLIPGSPCTLTSGQFTNRVYEVTEDVVLPVVCWNSCDDCGSSGPPPVNVTFQVDMSQYASPFNTVNVHGGFNGWCGFCAPLSDDDGDGIYSIDVVLPSDTVIDYKFILETAGDAVDETFDGTESCVTVFDGGFVNRTATFTANTVMDPVCWNSCELCVSSLAEADFEDLVDIRVNQNSISGVLNDMEWSGADLLLRDLSGRIVGSQKVNRTFEMNTTSQSAGIYILSLDNGSTSVSKRIAIIR